MVYSIQMGIHSLIFGRGIDRMVICVYILWTAEKQENSGPKKFWSWLGHFFVAQVVSANPGSGNFLQKFQIFWSRKNLIGLGLKIPCSNIGRPLFSRGSEVCVGWVEGPSLSHIHQNKGQKLTLFGHQYSKEV